MGRIFGIALFVLLLWFVAQNYAGVMPFGEVSGNAVATLPQLTGEKVMDAHQQSEERRRKLLGE